VLNITSLPHFTCNNRVLKRDGSSGGHDVYILTDRAAGNAIIESSIAIQSELPFHHEREVIPGWVLQEHISNPLLCAGRKFHTRVYALCCHNGDTYVHEQVEVRVAESLYNSSDLTLRNANITNGAGGSGTQRALTTDLPELAGLTAKLIAFVSEILQGVPAQQCAHDDTESTTTHSTGTSTDSKHYFSLLAFDVMVDTSERLWLLEVNHNPAVPNKDIAGAAFWEHLVQLCTDIIITAADGAVQTTSATTGFRLIRQVP
jgi:Tubulin-tyrosine ligase family